MGDIAVAVIENLCTGAERASPVTGFTPTGFRFYDMIGNVWEWTTDWWSARHAADVRKPCCVTENRHGGREDDNYDSSQAQIKSARTH